MSTRGCVAIGTPEHWQGVYNHWDSYPTYLGAKLWEHLHPNGQLRDLNAFAEDLLMYGDWREYLNRGASYHFRSFLRLLASVGAFAGAISVEPRRARLS